MEIAINNLQEKTIITPSMQQILISVLQKTAEVYDITPHTEVSLVLVSDDDIQALNLEYRGINRPTDVLSFVLNEGEEPKVIDGPKEVLLGDIIISIETATRQAAEYGHSLERELAYLTVHGILHLLGYDHMTVEDKHDMRREEEHVLSLLGINRV